MRLHEFYNRLNLARGDNIARHQAEIERDIKTPTINAGRTQEIMNFFKVDPKTASNLLDLEARKARQVIKNIETEVDKEIEDKERERVMQLVQAISDISAYEESQAEMASLVDQYMSRRK